jgi:ornithine carbamoyltransferase
VLSRYVDAVSARVFTRKVRLILRIYFTHKKTRMISILTSFIRQIIRRKRSKCVTYIRHSNARESILTFIHVQAVEELAGNATIPVVNALDDFAHPCQVHHHIYKPSPALVSFPHVSLCWQMLADLLTIAEVRGSTDFKGMKMAFVGDCQARILPPESSQCIHHKASLV